MPALASEVASSGSLVRLQGVGLASNLDRYITAPVLVVLAHQFHASLAGVAAVASVHLIAYGLMQLPWALVFTRHGAVRTMRVALLVAGMAAIAAALAPSLTWLLVARLVGGAFLGAAVPAAMLYVGGEMPHQQQARGFRAIVSANGVGIVLAFAVGAMAARSEAWRPAYLAVGLIILPVGLLVRGLRREAGREPSALSSQPLGRELEGRPKSPIDVVTPLLLVLLEGMAVVGAVFVMPAIAERGGAGPVAAGLALALYGLAMPVTSVLLRLAGWTEATLRQRLVGASGLLFVAGGSLLALGPRIAASLAAFVLGGAWSVLHPALQDAASRAWPRQRTYVVASFVTALFIGSAAGSQLLPKVLDRYGLHGVALLCAVSTLLLLAVKILLRRMDDALSRRRRRISASLRR